MSNKAFLANRWQRSLLLPLGAIGVLVLPGCAELAKQLPFPLNNKVNRSTAVSVPAQSPSIAQMEKQVHQQINTIRQKEGLSQLKPNEKLAQVARDYSRKMAEQNFFSHTSPQGDTMVQRVQSVGIFYSVIGENLFKGTNIPQPAPTAVKGWMNSPGHRKNILRSEYRETGIGVWKKGNTYYFTQLFMRSVW